MEDSDTIAIRTLLVGCLLTILIFVCYSNGFQNPFVYDDYRSILDNGSIVSLGNLPRIVGHETIRPVVNFTYALNWTLWRTVPDGYHLVSVLLHVVNVFLFHLLVSVLVVEQSARSWIASRRTNVATVAAVAAGLFAVHPVMTQAVAYASARGEVLGTTFLLLAFLAARRWMESHLGAWWVFTLILWLLGVFSNDSAMVFPLLLVCYEVLREKDRRWWRVTQMYLPFFGIAIAALVVRAWPFVRLEGFDLVHVQWRAFFDQTVVAWRYLYLLVDPREQAIYHSVRSIAEITDRQALWATLGLLASLGVAVRGGRPWALARFGVLWFWVFLLPFALLAVLGRSNEMAEQRVYLASCGVFVTAGVLASWVLSTLRVPVIWVRRLAVLALIVVLLFLGTRSARRVALWSDPVALWSEARQYSPPDGRLEALLGEALHRDGRHAEAVDALARAVLLNPDDRESYVALAVCLAETGREPEVQTAAERLRLRSPDSAYVPIALGAAATIAGRPERAREYLTVALAQDQNNVPAREWLARIAEETPTGAATAVRWCEELQQLAPDRRSTDECVRRNRARLAAGQ